MKANKERAIVVEVEYAGAAPILDRPATLVVTLVHIRTECVFRNYSTAVAAGKRIARELKLHKIHARHCWRSET